MRELVSRKVNGLNEVLRVEALDAEGQGGASHVYRITPTVGNATGVVIEFQNGPLQETDGIPNGISGEALLAIVEDRLIGFQSGQFAGDSVAKKGRRSVVSSSLTAEVQFDSGTDCRFESCRNQVINNNPARTVFQ